MKIQLLALVIAVTIGLSGYAQCDKKSIISSSKTEHLDANGEVQRSVDELSLIEFDKKEIIINAGDSPEMRGTIDSVTCDWKVPFKEGKTVLKVSLVDPNGQQISLTITIEGKDGKISFLAVMGDTQDRKIRITVDTFEEKK